MTDFHSHFLPALDDGSDSVETSLQMLALWRGQGQVDRLCATPHFYAEHNTPPRFLRRRARALESLTLAAAEQGAPLPEILPGAEVRFFDGIGAAEELPTLCLAGTNLLLLEMPFVPWTDRMLKEVAELRRRGLTPVAAHVERYMGFNSARMMRAFFDLDILIQCNAEFFLTRHTARKALRMLDAGQIHFLGSDAHNTTTRPPNLAAALTLIGKKLGPGAIDRLRSLEEAYLPPAGAGRAM